MNFFLNNAFNRLKMITKCIIKRKHNKILFALNKKMYFYKVIVIVLPKI